jgi:uncharacterized membrane protein HdeD (DUF308 family)
MKVNLEITKVDRLRVVIGVLMALGGIFTVLLVGAAFAYGNTTVWLVGLSLIIGGILISKSRVVIELAEGLLRF